MWILIACSGGAREGFRESESDLSERKQDSDACDFPIPAGEDVEIE